MIVIPHLVMIAIFHFVLRVAGCHWRVHHHFRLFWTNPFCVVDLLVVVLDCGIMVVESYASQGRVNFPVESLRLIRLARVMKLLRAGRVISQIRNRVERDPVFFNVELANGDVLKSVHRSRLTSLDAAEQMSLLEDRNVEGWELRQAQTRRIPGIIQRLTHPASRSQIYSKNEEGPPAEKSLKSSASSLSPGRQVSGLFNGWGDDLLNDWGEEPDHAGLSKMDPHAKKVKQVRSNTHHCLNKMGWKPDGFVNLRLCLPVGCSIWKWEHQ